MCTPAQSEDQSEAETLVNEFLRRNLVSPRVAQQAERLLAEDAPIEALNLVLDARATDDSSPAD